MQSEEMVNLKRAVENRIRTYDVHESVLTSEMHDMVAELNSIRRKRQILRQALDTCERNLPPKFLDLDPSLLTNANEITGGESGIS